MKHVAIFILSILLSTSSGFGQTRTITGKVIDAQFYPIYQARINNYDTALLVTTDVNGNFKIDIPVETKSLIVSWIGMEWKLINLPSSCDHLEIIMISSGTYDFMSARKVDRHRKKEFDKLPTLYQSAFEKDIFKMNKPCYIDKFITIKKQLK